MPTTKKPAIKAVAKKTIAKPAVKKAATKPATKPAAKKTTAKPAAKKATTAKATVKKTSKVNRNEDEVLGLVSIIRLTLEVIAADGNVAKVEANFLVDVVKAFGVTDPIAIGQLIIMGRKMSLSAAIKQVSSFREPQKK